jgi:hypothetical protein
MGTHGPLSKLGITPSFNLDVSRANSTIILFLIYIYFDIVQNYQSMKKDISYEDQV